VGDSLVRRIKALARAVAQIELIAPCRMGANRQRQRKILHGRIYRPALAALIVIAGVSATVAAAKEFSSTRPRQAQREKGQRETYGHHVFGGPEPGLKAAAGAGISQAKGTPPEWGGGAAGYAKRFGSAFGKHVIKGSIHYGVARLRHEELDYHPSDAQGFRRRLQYALLSTVITRKTTTGKKTVSTGEIAGALGSGLISRLWQPASLHTWASGFGSAGISLGADAGFNVVREFWPEIRHPHRRREQKAKASRAAALGRSGSRR
jgi:hypothetical protein